MDSVPKIPLIPEDPTPAIAEHLYLSIDEKRRLLDAVAGTEIDLMTDLGANTGARISELLAVQWPDLDLLNGVWVIRRALWQGVEDSPKGGERVMALHPALVPRLRSAPRHYRSPYVFCDSDGNPRTYDWFDWRLEKAAAAAGLAKVKGAHILRHTMASHLAMSGASPQEIQTLLGHKDLKTSMRYMHLSPKKAAEAVARLMR